MRCPWPSNNELMLQYHDEEWGVPEHDDSRLFEFMVLDAFQAGLSWSTILNKRENFRKAFDGFDPQKVAGYSEGKIESLVDDAGIIRNRLKISSTVSNAAVFMEVQKEFGSFDTFIWGFVGGRTIQNRWRRETQIPTKTRESDRMSEALKKRGFKFVGSTICYAFMQAVGMVNDHIVTCFRHSELGGG